MNSKKVLVLFSHPTLHKSRVNSQLLQAIRGVEGITIRELYEEYPQFHIDVKAEQKLLLEHDIIVWQHPFYWYSAPSIMKEWLDLVLEHGFAYGRTGKALEGKWVFNAITTGGAETAYRPDKDEKHSVDEYLLPFRQTAKLCRMRYLPPFVIHGTHLLENGNIGAYAERYKSLLISLRDGLFSDAEIQKQHYLNDLLNET